MNHEPKVWTVPELAVAAGVHEQTVRKDIDRTVLPTTRHAGRFVITDAAAQHYIEYRKAITQAQAVVDSVRASTQERKERRDGRTQPPQ